MVVCIRGSLFVSCHFEQPCFSEHDGKVNMKNKKKNRNQKSKNDAISHPMAMAFSALCHRSYIIFDFDIMLLGF